jgi:hypothetical protein
MFVHRQWHIVLPEIDQAVAFLLAVLINAQVNFCGQRINIPGGAAGGVKGFGVAQIIHQVYKVPCGFIGVGAEPLLYFFPAGFVLFYKKAFSQVAIDLGW